MTRPFKLLVLLVVLLLVSGGSLVAVWAQRDAEQPVTILGPWTDNQEDQFEKVLRSFGIPFDYQGTAAQREVLLSKVQSGEPPDIAIMPGVGELAEYADQGLLTQLDGLYDAEEYAAPWKSAGRTAGGVYWVPVKADLKSIVWYREGDEPADSPAPLESWCIGMGDDGASGWPGSDWIEDLVLQRAGPDTYGRWALGRQQWTSKPVRAAWEAWAGLLRQNTDAAENALLTDHRGVSEGHGLLFSGAGADSGAGAGAGAAESGAEAGAASEADREAGAESGAGSSSGSGSGSGSGGCALEHQGSFARSFYDGNPAALTDSAPLLPAGPYPVRAHEVTGDFAALFSDRPQARNLIKKLASAEGQRTWATYPDVFSANRQVPRKPGPIGKAIADRLTGERPRCLDASDVMAPAVRDAFYEAALLTIARAADKADLRITDLLKDLQRVQDKAQPDREAGLETVCSTA